MAALTPATRQTLTNTRMPPAVATATTATTLDPDCDLYDQYTFTALASNLTINIPGNGAANCTPANGQILVFSFANSAPDTTRTLTWAGIESVGGYSEESTLALPTTTIANAVLTLQVRYNATTTHWALVAMTPLDTTSDSTPRRVAISLTNGVATVPGPDTADMVYHHNLIEGTGNDVHFNAPTGAATAGQKLLFELLATQAGVVDVSWDADAYCFNGGIAQPTRVSGTAVTQIYDYWQFLRNPTAGIGGTPCWVLIAVASSTEALEPGTLIMGEAGGASAAYGAFTVPAGSLDLSGAINGSAGTPHLTYVQPNPPTRQALTNTRVRQEVAIVPTTDSLDPDCDLYEQYSITALAETLTINSPGNSAANCTPTDGQYLVFLFANSAPATTHALSWTTGVPGAYSNEHTIPLPTVTLADKVLAVQFRYNATTLRWGLIGTTPVGAALVNPMTLPGQMIYGGAAGAPTALNAGSGLLHMNGVNPPTIDDATMAKTFLSLENVSNTSDTAKWSVPATLTQKSIDLASNPVTGTLAQFNTACTDCEFASQVGAEKLTNKRVPPRSLAQASTATLAPDLAVADVYVLTALTQALTINPPISTGSAFSDNELLTIVIYSVAPQTLTWSNATNGFIAGSALPLPTTTVAGTETTMIFRRSALDSKWHFIGADVPSAPLAVTSGGTGAAPGAGDQVLVSDSTSAATWRLLTDCTGANKAMTYVAASNTFGCNTISGTGGDVSKVGTPVNNQVGVWTGNGTLEGDPALTFAAGALTVGVPVTTPGALGFTNNTSGVLTLAPPAGVALGTNTLTLPNVTGTLMTALPAPHRTKSCVVVIGDPGAASATLANDNDTPDVCPNDFGAVWTITTVACKSNTGSPTITPVLTGGAPTSLVTGAITCGQTWSPGVVQTSPAAALNSFSAAGATCTTPCTIDVNITAASTAKYIVVKIVGTIPGT